MLIWNILLILILVALNGFFVAVEFAVVASRRTKIDVITAQGGRSARIVKAWLENPASRDRMVAAAQLGITIVSLALGSVGEQTLENLLEPFFHQLALPPTMQFLVSILPALPLVISLVITTSLHVVLGEQVPKVAALHRPEEMALLLALPMQVFNRVFKRFVDILDWLTRMILRLIGLQSTGSHTMLYSVEELKHILAESQLDGVIDEPGREMMHAVLDFGELVVRQVMIPRTEIEAVQGDSPFEEIVEIVKQSSVTKFPVYEETLDQIIGILHVKRILGLMGKPESHNLCARDLAREAVFVPEASPVNELLRLFRHVRQHIAIVLDEYGGTAGLVTLEDLMEEIVGEVSDPFDPLIPEIHHQPDGTYLIDGLALIEDVNEQLELNLDDPNYDTIAGFVLGQIGNIPKEGDQIEIDGMRVKVEKMDNLRIERVSLVLLERAADEE